MELNRVSQYAETISGVVLAGHFKEPDTYVSRRPAGMSDWLITYTLGGEGYFRTPEGERIVRANDLALLKPGTPHQYGTVRDSEWHFVWAHFSQMTAETHLLPEDGLYVTTIDTPSAHKRIHRCFRRILSDSRERKPYWQELCMNALKEVFLLLLQRSERGSDPRIEEIRHYLSERLHHPIRVEALAAAVGLSPSRLSHLFKAHTGQTIIDTVNQMRVQQAALLLEHTRRSASEVCEDVGFQNYNHFINQFKKWFGMSPSAYRKAQAAGKAGGD